MLKLGRSPSNLSLWISYSLFKVNKTTAPYLSPRCSKCLILPWTSVKIILLDEEDGQKRERAKPNHRIAHAVKQRRSLGPGFAIIYPFHVLFFLSSLLIEEGSRQDNLAIVTDHFINILMAEVILFLGYNITLSTDLASWRRTNKPGQELKHMNGAYLSRSAWTLPPEPHGNLG